MSGLRPGDSCGRVSKPSSESELLLFSELLLSLSEAELLLSLPELELLSLLSPVSATVKIRNLSVAKDGILFVHTGALW